MTIGAVIAAVSALLLGVLFLYLAMSFMKGKNVELIAGYSSMSDIEKRKCDIKQLGKANGRALLVVSVLTLVFSCVSFLTAFEIVSEKLFVPAVFCYIIVVVGFSIISAARANK